MTIGYLANSASCVRAAHAFRPRLRFNSVLYAFMLHLTNTQALVLAGASLVSDIAKDLLLKFASLWMHNTAL